MSPGATTFTLFPWAGFLLAGGAVGLWLDAARTDAGTARDQPGVPAVGGDAGAWRLCGVVLPPIYAQTNFWTSSPTFFFLRLGIAHDAASRRRMRGTSCVRGPLRGSPLREFGRSSLFVYWIHVEMVYGVLSAPLHRQSAVRAGVRWRSCLFSLFLFALVKLEERVDHGSR